MFPDNTHARSLQHHHLMAPITVISGYTQLLQRQVLRARGLTTLERDQLLGNLAAMRDAAQAMCDRLEVLVERDDLSLNVTEDSRSASPAGSSTRT